MAFSSYICAAVITALAAAIYTAVYRLFLSPLGHVPGPKLAALTSWYECYYDVVQPGQYVFKIKELHQRFGPIIRITPNDVHVSDPDFLDKIYAPRDRNQLRAGGLLVEQSVGGTPDWHVHKMRREALNPYFSLKNVLMLEPLLMSKLKMLREDLDKAAQSGKPFILSDAYFAFSNDLVRSFSFGKDNGLLSDLPEANRQRNDLARLLQGIQVSRQFPWLLTIVGALPVSAPPALKDLLNFKASIREEIKIVLDDKRNDSKGGHSVFYDLKDSPTLPPHEKTLSRLEDEATLLVMAGTESTAKSISIAHFYLLSKPNVLAKLRRELSSFPSRPPSLNDLLGLPYLNAIIQEANRLSFGVTGRLVRQAPRETLTYIASSGPHQGTHYPLPPNTRLSTVTYCTHTDETLFPDPWAFEPERWLGSGEEISRRKRCMMALGKGHRKCLGINVANAALCLTLSNAADYDMELFETDETDIKFKHDYQISHPRLDTKGIRAIVKGKA